MVAGVVTGKAGFVFGVWVAAVAKVAVVAGLAGFVKVAEADGVLPMLLC